MSLAEKLKSKTVLTKTLVVDGDTFNVRGLDLASKARVYAKARKSDGSIDGVALDSSFLASCVVDPETGLAVGDAAFWRTIPGHITGPLLATVGEVCGMSTDRTIDPKDLDSTEN